MNNVANSRVCPACEGNCYEAETGAPCALCHETGMVRRDDPAALRVIRAQEAALRNAPIVRIMTIR